MGTVFKTLYPKVAEIEIEKGRKKDTFPAICYSGLRETCPFVFPFGFPFPRLLGQVFSQRRTRKTIILKRRGRALHLHLWRWMEMEVYGGGERERMQL